MKFYQKRTAEEQANRLPEELRQAYLKSQVDRIKIFDGSKEIEVTGYAEYSYLDEKSYKTQPVRTQDGAVTEIEQYATFLTPRLIIKYNMMGIDDYRALMKMLKSRNGFIVKCYDVVEDKTIKCEMYVAPPSMPKIYHQYLVAMGIQDFSIELIGTNTFQDIPFYVMYQSAVKYTAQFGHTWREWVGSTYNTGGYKLLETYNGTFIQTSDGSQVIFGTSSPIEADEYIIYGKTYNLYYAPSTYEGIMNVAYGLRRINEEQETYSETI